MFIGHCSLARLRRIVAPKTFSKALLSLAPVRLDHTRVYTDIRLLMTEMLHFVSLFTAVAHVL